MLLSATISVATSAGGGARKWMMTARANITFAHTCRRLTRGRHALFLDRLMHHHRRHATQQTGTCHARRCRHRRHHHTAAAAAAAAAAVAAAVVVARQTDRTSLHKDSDLAHRLTRPCGSPFAQAEVCRATGESVAERPWQTQLVLLAETSTVRNAMC
jgi:predicted membrane-bound mannosyltransferase